MVDGVGWKRNRIPTPSASPKDVSKDAIDKELVIHSVNTLVKLLQRKTHQLRAELTIIKTIIYKHHNQHRKEKYFQVLKKVVKCVTRLEEYGIYRKIAEVKDKFPKLSKHGTLVDNTISCCPFVEMVVNFLGDLKVAANLVSKAMSMCKETFQVFLKVCLTDVVKCYEVMFPWLQVLGRGAKMFIILENLSILDLALSGVKGLMPRGNPNAEDLPSSLKILLEPVTDQNTETSDRISLLATPSTNVSTQGFLDKLFAPTPQDKPKDEAIPLPDPVCGLEESMMAYEPNSLTKNAIHLTDTKRCKQVEQTLPSSSPITDDWRNLKRKLFAGVSSNNQQEDGRNFSKKMKQEGAAIKRSRFVVCKRSTCKHRERDFKRLQIRGCKRSVKSSPCNIIHVFSDRRWNSYKEALQQRKSFKRSNGNAKGAQNPFRQSLILPEYNEAKIDRDIKEQTALNKMNQKITLIKNPFRAPNQGLGVSRCSRENKFCGLEGNFLLPEARHSTTNGNDFIEHHMSLSSKTSGPKESTQERTEHYDRPFDNEIDSIFSLLDD